MKSMEITKERRYSIIRTLKKNRTIRRKKSVDFEKEQYEKYKNSKKRKIETYQDMHQKLSHQSKNLIDLTSEDL